ncbi:unnamed protein product, partial [Closterium sp. Naga37s-1]
VSLGQNKSAAAGGSAGPPTGASSSAQSEVVRFGEADKGRSAVCSSACVAVDERSSIVAVGRKHGM